MRRAVVVLMLVSVLIAGAPLKHRRVRERAAVVAKVVEAETAQDMAPAVEGSAAALPDVATKPSFDTVRRAEARRRIWKTSRCPGPALIAALCAAYPAALVLSLFFGIRRELS